MAGIFAWKSEKSRKKETLNLFQKLLAEFLETRPQSTHHLPLIRHFFCYKNGINSVENIDRVH